MAQEYLLTPRGLERIKQALEQLKNHDRHRVIERIKAAKEFGDIAENSEYEDAKNEQSFIEGRIQELEMIIKRAQVIPEDKDKSRVGIGDKVIVYGEGKETFEIVDSAEADPESGKISADSPIGQALIGRQVGDSVSVRVPDGQISYKLLSIL